MKLNTRPGQLWMFILRRAFASALVTARKELFRPRVGPRVGDAGTRERVTSAATAEQKRSTVDERVEELEWLSRSHSDADIFLAARIRCKVRRCACGGFSIVGYRWLFFRFFGEGIEEEEDRER